jgi:hypothetical protein
MDSQIKRLLRAEVPAYLKQAHNYKTTRGSLANLAMRGGGPRFYKIGNRTLYPVEELDLWINSRLGPLRKSTSELAASAA